MKKLTIILIITVLFPTASCKVVGTLYPLSDNSDNYIFKKEILGRWGDVKDSSEYFLIDSVCCDGGKGYIIDAYSRNNEKQTIEHTRFNAFIIKIDGLFYLDCSYKVENGLPTDKQPLEDLLMPRHFIFRLSFPDMYTIEIESPDTDEIIKLTDQKKLSLHYLVLQEDNYLILDKPGDLQKNIAQSKKYIKMFNEKNILKKLN